MRRLLTVGAAALLLGGCDLGDSLGLNGASSMRVEVDVYKGPLGHGTEFQRAELRAVLKEAVRALDNWSEAATSYRLTRNADCEANAGNRQGCRYLEDAIVAAREAIDDFCRIGIKVPGASYRSHMNRDYPNAEPDRQVFAARDHLQNESMEDICTPHRNIRGASTPIATRQRSAGQPQATSDVIIDEVLLGEMSEPEARAVTEAASALQAKAFRIETAFVGFVPPESAVRRLLVDFKILASEYANQIRSRNGVLEKQLANGVPDGRLLPTGEFLRDASPTDFIHLYEWYDAAIESRWRPIGGLGVADRIRIAERLFADHYWEKVNEVYASGQGDVSMAFIKNEIGNWDLKSFGNEPGKLLAAYSSAASAAIKASVELATGNVAGLGGEALSRSERLLDMGNRIATGQSSQTPTMAGMDAAKLHDRALAKMKGATERAKQREDATVGERAAAVQAKTAATADVTRLEGELTTAEAKRTAAQNAVAQCATSAGGPCANQTLLDALSSAQSDVASKSAEIASAKSKVTEQEALIAAADAELARIRADLVQALRDALDDHLHLIAAFQEFVAGPQGGSTNGVATPMVPTL